MNITIYIRKDLEERFKAEPDKSKLINGLLDIYYQKHAAMIGKTVQFQELRQQYGTPMDQEPHYEPTQE